jgi:hypothetical protein
MHSRLGSDRNAVLRTFLTAFFWWSHGPQWTFCLKGNGRVIDWPRKRKPPGMEAHWRTARSERLLGTKLLLRKIGRITNDWIPEAPKVDANLIGASGAWNCFNDCLAIGAPEDNAKDCLGGVTRFLVNYAEAILERLTRDSLPRDHFFP